jgi:metallo-beta-lactamase family protein
MGGTVFIPSFKIEQAQMIMYLLWQLREEGKIPDVLYIIDLPMGVSTFDIFFENRKWHKLSLEDYIAINNINKMFTMITDYKETIDAIYNKASKVVVAASVMVTGGRILSYLERYISLAETTVILEVYQAEVNWGRKLLQGAKEVKIYGKYYPVEAKILEIERLSAHADQKGLLNWLSALAINLKKYS